MEKETAESRFWKKVRKSDGCWEWTAFVHPGGYGMFWYGGRMQQAHRCSYIFTHGQPPPDRPFVLHKVECSNKICVRPDHLYAGTSKQNAEDSMAVGTFHHPVPRRALTPAQTQTLRTLPPRMTQKAVAK